MCIAVSALQWTLYDQKQAVPAWSVNEQKHDFQYASLIGIADCSSKNKTVLV